MSDPVHGGEATRWGGWHWRAPDRGQHYRTCSYCGCINPDDLAAEPTWRAEWADRKYGWPHKFYVDVPNRDPDALFAISGRREAREGPYAPGGEHYTPPGPGMIAWADLTPEQLAILERDGWRSEYDYVQFGPRASFHAKFYTAHLADPDISDETREAIHRRCGLVFTFEDGRVRWRGYAY